MLGCAWDSTGSIADRRVESIVLSVAILTCVTYSKGRDKTLTQKYIAAGSCSNCKIEYRTEGVSDLHLAIGTRLF